MCKAQRDRPHASAGTHEVPKCHLSSLSPPNGISKLVLKTKRSLAEAPPKPTPRCSVMSSPTRKSVVGYNWCHWLPSPNEPYHSNPSVPTPLLSHPPPPPAPHS